MTRFRLKRPVYLIHNHYRLDLPIGGLNYRTIDSFHKPMDGDSILATGMSGMIGTALISTLLWI